jgi:hypothetical protein
MITKIARRRIRLVTNAAGTLFFAWGAWNSAQAGTPLKFGFCIAVVAFCVTKFADDTRDQWQQWK